MAKAKRNTVACGELVLRDVCFQVVNGSAKAERRVLDAPSRYEHIGQKVACEVVGNVSFPRLAAQGSQTDFKLFKSLVETRIALPVFSPEAKTSKGRAWEGDPLGPLIQVRLHWVRHRERCFRGLTCLRQQDGRRIQIPTQLDCVFGYACNVADVCCCPTAEMLWRYWIRGHDCERESSSQSRTSCVLQCSHLKLPTGGVRRQQVTTPHLEYADRQGSICRAMRAGAQPLLRESAHHCHRRSLTAPAMIDANTAVLSAMTTPIAMPLTRLPMS